MRAATNPSDWVSQFIAGNLAYRVAPAAALEFHLAAAKLAPDTGAIHLELAHDYQRMGQCERAVPEWLAADKLGALRSPVTAVAAYCFLRVGRVDEGIALWQRVQWPAHRVQLDFAISSMFFGTSALQTHADAYAKAQAGDEQALNTLLGNALEWHIDWWNVRTNQPALDAARALAKSMKPQDQRLHRELDCASQAIAIEEGSVLLELLKRCRLLVAGGDFPANSTIGRFLVARMQVLDVAPERSLLDRYGKLLDARARSTTGDRAALETLGFLQSVNGEQTALAASDELGWRRYGLVKFAGSRIVGLIFAPDAPSQTQGAALLKEALRDFPNDALLNRLRFEALPTASTEREQALLAWILGEYHGLRSNAFGSPPGVPTSTTLARMVGALRQMRSGAER